MIFGLFASNRPGNKGTITLFGITMAAIVLSIIMQFYVSETIGPPFTDTWRRGCPDDDFQSVCFATTSVLRVSAALVIFLALVLVGTFINAMFYDIFNIYKVFVFAAIVIGFMNMTSTSMLQYAWFARFAAFIFLIYQQIILIDFAYNWNESWVAKSESSSNNSWLYALIGTSALFFATSIAGLAILFWTFFGCPENNAILIITVLLCTLATGLQLFVSLNGSLLVSSVVVLYSTYLCYAALSLNPSTECNPTLSTKYQDLTKAMGIVLTVISLAYTAYSTVDSAPQVIVNSGVADKKAEVVEGADVEEGAPEQPSNGIDLTAYKNDALRKVFFLVIFIFITMAAYYAMVLTNWATLQSGAVQKEPKTGTVALWLQAAGQWIALILYSWTLVAPRLFPDRDFSAQSSAP